jgi:uncharacterized membrane protein
MIYKTCQELFIVSSITVHAIIVLLVALLWLMAPSFVSAELQIDISGSQYETKSSDTVRIRNFTIPGMPDKYWADFQWNPYTMTLVPISAGVDSTVAVKTSFVYEDFAGKALYYTASGIYQLAVFYPDGTAQASAMMSYGTPTLQPYYAYWSIADGCLFIVANETIRYALISDNQAERYYRVNKYSANGYISVVRFYYDQETGLSQAQAFVASKQQP